MPIQRSLIVGVIRIILQFAEKLSFFYIERDS
ncbi:uncharacterized protein METZ01_LOCUS318280 [marine metagenome]|uniref:Uncharacterized protein n=1 Tax=marine metagenome TaxID=408172 RepID=A0A382NWK5_9ZZZZ